MATKAPAKGAPAAAPAKSATKTINRNRRNSFMRKSLPKYLKTLYGGSSPSTFRSVFKAWQESRKKPTSSRSDS